jgi:ornithine cyclodeaminase
MNIKTITHLEVEPSLNWSELLTQLTEGHKLPKAKIKDTLITRRDDTLLSRVAWIDGLGQLVKTATIFPKNNKKKSIINGSVSLFSDQTGELEAFIDFHLLTKWKTAADSLLAAKHLARKNSNNILLVGSGNMSSAMLAAYKSIFPEASFFVWSRTSRNAAHFAEKNSINVVKSLRGAVRSADIVCTATMSAEPLIKGDWLQAGQHIDLIGAYRPDMLDDNAIKKGKIFVDSYETTVQHIGEIKLPLQSGVIKNSDILADFYSLDQFKRSSPSDITIAKNGGGAHLDLMTAKYILNKWKEKIG